MAGWQVGWGLAPPNAIATEVRPAPPYGLGADSIACRFRQKDLTHACGVFLLLGTYYRPARLIAERALPCYNLAGVPVWNFAARLHVLRAGTCDT